MPDLAFKRPPSLKAGIGLYDPIKLSSLYMSISLFFLVSANI